MKFSIDRQYMYNKDLHNSNKISYKTNKLAKKNTVNNIINIVFSRDENHLNLHEV